MFSFFRQIRRQIVNEGTLRKYFFYAIGEVVLVVVGILIALQINNGNELRVQRQSEISYLKNLKVDLQLNIQELDKFITDRNGRIKSARRMIEYFEGAPLDDLEDFNYHNIHVQLWQKFYQNNNTFQELVNSGNLGIISDYEIKNALMNLELLYKKMKSNEDHMRYDFEGYVFEPFFDAVDIDPMTKNYVYTSTDGQAGEKAALSKEAAQLLLRDIKYKNGFTLAIYMNTVINAEFEVLRLKTMQLIELIDNELTRQ